MSIEQRPGPARAPLTRREFPGDSRQARWVDRALRLSVRKVIDRWARNPEGRWAYRSVDWVGRPLIAKPVRRTRIQLPRSRAMLLDPPVREGGRFVLYLHGGGFIVGGRHLHRQMTARFATELRTQLLAVDYRKLPAHTLADALADCVDGYERALAWGVAPENITVMGDSAGATLTLLTAVEIRRRGLPLPAALVAMSPLTDFDITAKLAAPSAAMDALFSPAAFPVLAEFALRGGHLDGVTAPAHTDLTGLPPTLIQVSSTEFLYPDGVLVAERLHEHGVACDLQIWHNQVHIFQAAASIAPEAAAAVGEIGAFVDRILGAGQVLDQAS
ncbi:alpha/beta hydrolase fold domain-containing protein [Nocardia sp. NPDC004415]